MQYSLNRMRDVAMNDLKVKSVDALADEHERKIELDLEICSREDLDFWDELKNDWKRDEESLVEIEEFIIQRDRTSESVESFVDINTMLRSPSLVNNLDKQDLSPRKKLEESVIIEPLLVSDLTVEFEVLSDNNFRKKEPTVIDNAFEHSSEILNGKSMMSEKVIPFSCLKATKSISLVEFNGFETVDKGEYFEVVSANNLGKQKPPVIDNSLEHTSESFNGKSPNSEEDFPLSCLTTSLAEFNNFETMGKGEDFEVISDSIGKQQPPAPDNTHEYMTENYKGKSANSEKEDLPLLCVTTTKGISLSEFNNFEIVDKGEDFEVISDNNLEKQQPPATLSNPSLNTLKHSLIPSSIIKDTLKYPNETSNTWNRSPQTTLPIHDLRYNKTPVNGDENTTSDTLNSSKINRDGIKSKSFSASANRVAKQLNFSEKNPTKLISTNKTTNVESPVTTINSNHSSSTNIDHTTHPKKNTNNLEELRNYRHLTSIHKLRSNNTSAKSAEKIGSITVNSSNVNMDERMSNFLLENSLSLQQNNHTKRIFLNVEEQERDSKKCKLQHISEEISGQTAPLKSAPKSDVPNDFKVNIGNTKSVCKQRKSEETREEIFKEKTIPKLPSKANVELLDVQNDSKSEKNEDDKTINDQIHPEISSAIVFKMKECTKSWKLKYPWVEFNNEKCALICTICTLPYKPCTICTIKTNEDIFTVSSMLLRHSNSIKHSLLPLISSFKIFNDVYVKVKYHSWSYCSRSFLFEDLNSVCRPILGFNVKETTLELLIGLIASIIRESTLDKIKAKQNSSYTSFVFDPCRKILIARYQNDKTFFPEEHVVTDFMKSPLPARGYLTKNNISNPVFVNGFVNCRSCINCKHINPTNETLPPRWPRFLELLRWLESDHYFMNYSIFIKNVSVFFYYNKNMFTSLWGSEILSTATWNDFNIYSYILNNIDKLRHIFLCIYKKTQNLKAKFCFHFEINCSEIFGSILSLISLIKVHIIRETATLANPLFRELITKVDHYLLMAPKKDISYPYLQLLKYVKLYCDELNKEGYVTGRLNVNDFYIFFSCRSLILLQQNAWSAEATAAKLAFDKVFIFLQCQISATKEQLLNSLIYFNKRMRWSTEILTLNEILERFSCDFALRTYFPLVFHFYCLLATLPFFPAAIEKSFFGTSCFRVRFGNVFESEMAIDLLSITLEGPRVTVPLHQDLIRVICSKYN